MEKRMKHAEAIESLNSLKNILGREEKYPVAFSFAISKNMKALQAAESDFLEARNKLLDEYNAKDEDGNPLYLKTGKIEIAKEHEVEWEKAVRELLDIEITVPVHMVDIANLEGLDIEASVLYACDFMLK